LKSRKWIRKGIQISGLIKVTHWQLINKKVSQSDVSETCNAMGVTREGEDWRAAYRQLIDPRERALEQLIDSEQPQG
jgi:hypothetical protein